MSLEKLEKKLSSLSEETKSLYNKIDERYRIAINGKGTIELVDISNFKVLVRGEKKIREEMKNFLRESPSRCRVRATAGTTRRWSRGSDTRRTRSRSGGCGSFEEARAAVIGQPASENGLGSVA